MHVTNLPLAVARVARCLLAMLMPPCWRLDRSLCSHWHANEAPITPAASTTITGRL